MDRIVSALVLLFLASIVPSNAQSEPLAPSTAAPVLDAALAPASLQRVYYDVGRNLSLKCDLTKEADQNYVWTKNGTNVESLKELADRYDLEQAGALFKIKGRSHEDDFGNYTCAAGGQAQGWEVHGRPHVKLPQNTNVVQEQKATMQCKVTGKPYPREVTWLFKNASEPAANVTSVVGADPREGLTLKANDQGILNGALVIERAQPHDAGEYSCFVVEEGPLSNSTTILRVKDMYAALWPFLGICAEVFVLCAIILVYEKRRTKPELDDSDTDNHDQKKS